jgi:hypothetical protein
LRISSSSISNLVITLFKEHSPQMKRKWTQLVIRVLPIVVAAVAVVVELEEIAARKWS